MGIVGFCWGALPVFEACSQTGEKAVFDCGATFHPSL